MTKMPPLTDKEKKFAQLLARGDSFADAARKVFRWRLETGNKAYERARTLSRSARVKKLVAKIQEENEKRKEMAELSGAEDLDWTALVKLAVERLRHIRDDPMVSARVRYSAIDTLEQIQDPSQDINLIWRYLDLIWDGLKAHCPCCHETFPLWKVKNPRLTQWRRENAATREPSQRPQTDFERRVRLIKAADKKDEAHPSQRAFLEASERHALGTGPARCLEENERVILADGRVLPAKELIDQEFEVVAYGPVGKQIRTPATASNNGTQTVYRIRTDNGREIVRTGNHPLLQSQKSCGQGTRTQVGPIGWKIIEDIEEGDLVLVPTQVKLDLPASSISDEQIKLTALLLGDGGVIKGITFTQKIGSPLLDEFRTLVDHFDCAVREVYPNKYKQAMTLCVRGKIRGQNYVTRMLMDWNLRGKHSRDKFFPDWVWTLDERQLCLFLRYLYACDGWASKECIGFCSASERMVRDVELVLLRLGICGRVRYKLSKYVYKGVRQGRDAWLIEVNRTEHTERFCQQVNIRCKEAAVEEVLKKVQKRKPGSQWRNSGAPPGYEWQVVTQKECLGERPTVAISVPNYETYLTTFVEHNTGKSTLLGMFAYLAMLIPKAETWILARIYDDAEYEIQYLIQYLSTAFYPLHESMFTFEHDKKTGEAKVYTRWGSILKIKSSKSKGSITGAELEFCLVAEPAWVDGDLFEEVRARMSSRLGRIIAMGTPKGFGGFVGRLMRMGSRDMRTGRRLDPGARLIKNGCPWEQSIFIYKLKPKDNPAYVTAELDAARMELTASEYASEFEGEAVGETGRKFPHVTDDHLVTFAPTAFDRSVIILGIDQGERNFAACLMAWDGVTMRVVDEYFDNTDKTIKANMMTLNRDTPSRLRAMGINPDRWVMTIFDADPIVSNQLMEMQEERNPWKTEITYRPKSKVDAGATWREETCMWMDQMACDGRLLFSNERCDQLHENVRDALQPANIDDESSASTRKKWIINDPIRSDHPADSWLMAGWVIYSHQVTPLDPIVEVHDPYDEARRAFEYRRAVAEKEELTGKANHAEIFEDVFGRPRGGGLGFFSGMPGYFDNES